MTTVTTQTPGMWRSHWMNVGSSVKSRKNSQVVGLRTRVLKMLQVGFAFCIQNSTVREAIKQTHRFDTMFLFWDNSMDSFPLKTLVSLWMTHNTTAVYSSLTLFFFFLIEINFFFLNHLRKISGLYTSPFISKNEASLWPHTQTKWMCLSSTSPYHLKALHFLCHNASM